MHVTNTHYQQVSECHEVKCSCGDVYKEHSARAAIFCTNCNIETADQGYTVCVQRDDHDTLSSIRQCPQCGGFDLEYWSNKQHILQQFQAGNKEVRIPI